MAYPHLTRPGDPIKSTLAMEYVIYQRAAGFLPARLVKRLSIGTATVRSSFCIDMIRTYLLLSTILFDPAACDDAPVDPLETTEIVQAANIMKVGFAEGEDKPLITKWKVSSRALRNITVSISNATRAQKAHCCALLRKWTLIWL